MVWFDRYRAQNSLFFNSCESFLPFRFCSCSRLKAAENKIGRYINALSILWPKLTGPLPMPDRNARIKLGLQMIPEECLRGNFYKLLQKENCLREVLLMPSGTALWNYLPLTRTGWLPIFLQKWKMADWSELFCATRNWWISCSLPDFSIGKAVYYKPNVSEKYNMVCILI